MKSFMKLLVIKLLKSIKYVFMASKLDSISLYDY